MCGFSQDSENIVVTELVTDGRNDSQILFYEMELYVYHATKVFSKNEKDDESLLSSQTQTQI